MIRRAGSILVLVLFVLAVLSLVAVSFAYRASLENRLVERQALTAKLQTQADSMLIIALARLAQNTNDFDHWAEPWHQHGPPASDVALPDWMAVDAQGLPEFIADYQVTDEEGKLHVEQASSEAMEKLGMNRTQADSLFDWIDNDDSPLPEGAEKDYYLRDVNPHLAKNGSLDVLEELLQIRGFDYASFIGEDANHNRVLDDNENDGPASPPMDDQDGALRLGWVDLLTAAGDGKININTAPREVLETLPITPAAVDQIIGYRFFDRDSRGELLEHVFRTAEDIEQLQGLSDGDRDVLKQVSRFRSEHFRIFVTATHRQSSIRHRVVALVRMTEQGPQVVMIQREH